MKPEMAGLQWHQLAICKSFALCFRHNHASTSSFDFFAGQMLFVTTNQQCQSTEGKILDTLYISVLCTWCVRSLEEDVAAFAESLSLKDEIVKSLTLQLADIRDNTAQSSCVGSSNTAHTLLETTHRLEQLSVFHSHLDYIYGMETCG